MGRCHLVGSHTDCEAKTGVGVAVASRWWWAPQTQHQRGWGCGERSPHPPPWPGCPPGTSLAVRPSEKKGAKRVGALRNARQPTWGPRRFEHLYLGPTHARPRNQRAGRHLAVHLRLCVPFIITSRVTTKSLLLGRPAALARSSVLAHRLRKTRESQSPKPRDAVLMMNARARRVGAAAPAGGVARAVAALTLPRARPPTLRRSGRRSPVATSETFRARTLLFRRPPTAQGQYPLPCRAGAGFLCHHPCSALEAGRFEPAEASRRPEVGRGCEPLPQPHAALSGLLGTAAKAQAPAGTLFAAQSIASMPPTFRVSR